MIPWYDLVYFLCASFKFYILCIIQNISSKQLINTHPVKKFQPSV